MDVLEKCEKLESYKTKIEKYQKQVKNSIKCLKTAEDLFKESGVKDNGKLVDEGIIKESYEALNHIDKSIDSLISSINNQGKKLLEDSSFEDRLESVAANPVTTFNIGINTVKNIWNKITK